MRNNRISAPVPSFIGLLPASEAASRAKRANRKRDTKPELLLRRALWALGLRYRTCARDLPGRPDVTFRASRVVVFCDGDFWHGRNWALLKRQLRRRHNSDYWIAKIGRNRDRDILHTSYLARDGWLVLRLWESDIVRDPGSAAIFVRDAINNWHRQRCGSAAEKSPQICRSSSGKVSG